MTRGESTRVVVSRVLFFARNFLKYPVMQGSLIPSSQFLVNDVLRQVDWDRARVLVEYGPGVGTLTQEILKRMRPDAILIAIELNRDFVAVLQREIQDERLKVVYGSALDVQKVLSELNMPRPDYIISSLPYSNMGESVRRAMVEHSKQVLGTQGVLLVFQYTTTLLPYLRSSFRSVRQDF
jgi:phospholipid N-methyltransferase